MTVQERLPAADFPRNGLRPGMEVVPLAAKHGGEAAEVCAAASRSVAALAITLTGDCPGPVVFDPGTATAFRLLPPPHTTRSAGFARFLTRNSQTAAWADLSGLPPLQLSGPPGWYWLSCPRRGVTRVRPVFLALALSAVVDRHVGFCTCTNRGCIGGRS
jgi:hypothetical protein